MARFLVDNCLSPRLAVKLCQSGHDAVHVAEYGMAQASDESILERAAAERRTVVSADNDFGALLALSRAKLPSVILFRGKQPSRPEGQVALITSAMPEIERPLAEDAVVVFLRGFVRIRRLPLH